MDRESMGGLLPRENFPHLSDQEWTCLPKLRAVMGSRAFDEFVPESPPDDLKSRASGFFAYEDALMREAIRQCMARVTLEAAAAPPTPTPPPVVVHVPTPPPSATSAPGRKPL